MTRPYTVSLNRSAEAELREFTQEFPFWKQQELITLALSWYIDYFRKYQALPPRDIRELKISKIPNEIAQLAADLPGMTAEVIQSHLVRFPKVTPEAYKGIIEELRLRQQSEEGLKNPEAAAYGLCKRIQNGAQKTSHQEPAAAQEPEPPQPTADMPDPFAVY